ncbi:uncharacterized protein LOC141622296 isoform X1 [Silene latifolia]|uniref:uncharacterized protein LOC141622296 isoform X1 n=1 Tax=Silene latifolia TaxID=37657 RepID=UPI003D7816F6
MNRHYQNIRKPRATLLILGCLVMSLCTSCSVGKSNDVYRKNITCIDQERDALLKFKHHIDSDSCRLVASWGNPHTPDCCTWEGVTCSNQSGHVIGLHLGGDPYLNVCLDSSVYSLYSLGELKRLTYLDLSGNLLSSIIPDAIENLQSLMYLDLSYNSLSGSSGSLSYFNLSNNRLEGSIPSAIGDSHSILQIDLSNNRLQGSIPSAIGDSHSLLQIDLSNNRLQGPIPSSLGRASLLSYLNLSNNHLEGVIPSSIANLKYLEYLDLSTNNLSGDIPCKLEITKPPYFANFSNNNLSGSVPKYLSSPGFDAFQGNPNFNIYEVQGPCDYKDNDKNDDKIYPGLYVSIGLGIYTGFWVFCGTLTVKTSWRHAYFGFLDHTIDKIYVTVAIYLARFRRNSQV